MKKIIVKKFKPAYIVNLADCTDLADAYWEFVFAKTDAGIPVTTCDLEYILEDLAMEVFNNTCQSFHTILNEELDNVTSCICEHCDKCKCECECKEEKKKPWWKKILFWLD